MGDPAAAAAAVPPAAPGVRRWRPGRPLDVRRTMASLGRGRGDPCQRVDAAGAVWRTWRTGDGPATVRLVADPTAGEVVAHAWGPGAECALAAVPDLLGARDDPTGFEPAHLVVRDGLRRWPGWRVPRAGHVLEVLAACVLEQRVTGGHSRASWSWLVGRYGSPAPGPAPAGMRVAPDPQQWAAIPSWDWHRAGVDPKRARTIVVAAGYAGRLEQTLDLPVADARARLAALPGVGPWTVAEVMQRAHGDADAVSVGDVHLPGIVGWALAGRIVDDAGMLELLAPYAGHRYRVTRLAEAAGLRTPRFGPRYAPLDFRSR